MRSTAAHQLHFQSRSKAGQFIKNYQIEDEFHGVGEMVGRDRKATIFAKEPIRTAAYQDGRAAEWASACISWAER